MPDTTFWSDDHLITSDEFDHTSSAVAGLVDNGFVTAVLHVDAMANNGNGDFDLEITRFDAAGVPTGQSFTLQSNGQIFKPTIIALANGGFAVAYCELVAEGSYAQVRVYDASGQLTGSYTGQGAYASAPSIAEMVDGQIVIAYVDFATEELTYYGLMSFNSMQILPGYGVSGPGGTDHAIAALGSDRVVTAYYESGNLQLRINDVTGATPSPFITVETGLDTNASFLDNPQIAVLNNGNFVVCYEGHYLGVGDSDMGIFARIYNDQGELVSATRLHVNTTSAFSQYDPQITALDDGGFMIVWTDQFNFPGETGNEIRAQRFDAAGNRVGGQFRVNADAFGSQWQPSISILADGRVVVTFATPGPSDNTYGDVAYRIIDPRGSHITGDAGDNFLFGGMGDSTVDGLDGNDRLIGLNGDDRINGGNGNDTLYGGGGDDVIDGGSGNDEIDGEGGDDTITGGSGNDTISGGQGYNVIDAGSGGDLVSTGGGTDEIWLGSGDDFASAGNGNDFIYGGIGADSLNGGGGADYLEGGADSDIYMVDHVGDRTVEAAFAGIDTVRATNVSWTLADNLENLIIVSGNYDGTGNALGNVITGSSGNNVLAGLDGADILKGMAGIDTLDGGIGNDNLNGGTGKDTMTGGAGADKFTFATLGDSTVGLTNADVITDFSHAQGDRIDLAAIDAVTGAAANEAFNFIGTAAFSNVAGQLRYRFDGAGNTVVSCDVNGDGAVDMSIVLTGEIALVASDFVL